MSRIGREPVGIPDKVEVEVAAGKISVKLRHGPEKRFCNVYPVKTSPNSIRVVLRGNDQGIASGQYAAFYRDNLCLGSGVIA